MEKKTIKRTDNRTRETQNERLIIWTVISKMISTFSIFLQLAVVRREDKRSTLFLFWRARQSIGEIYFRSFFFFFLFRRKWYDVFYKNENLSLKPMIFQFSKMLKGQICLVFIHGSFSCLIHSLVRSHFIFVVLLHILNCCCCCCFCCCYDALSACVKRQPFSSFFFSLRMTLHSLMFEDWNQMEIHAKWNAMWWWKKTKSRNHRRRQTTMSNEHNKTREKKKNIMEDLTFVQRELRFATERNSWMIFHENWKKKAENKTEDCRHRRQHRTDVRVMNDNKQFHMQIITHENNIKRKYFVKMFCCRRRCHFRFFRLSIRTEKRVSVLFKETTKRVEWWQQRRDKHLKIESEANGMMWLRQVRCG